MREQKCSEKYICGDLIKVVGWNIDVECADELWFETAIFVDADQQFDGVIFWAYELLSVLNRHTVVVVLDQVESIVAISYLIKKDSVKSNFKTDWQRNPGYY